MSLPSDLNLRTIVGTYVDYKGDPVSGQIRFTSNIRLISDGQDTAVLPSVIIGTLDASGQLKAQDGIAALTLPVTDDADLYPTGWTYSVVEEFEAPYDGVGITYNLEIPTDDINPLDLPAVSPGTPSLEPGVQAVTEVNGKDPNSLGQVTLVPADLGAASAVHTHAAADVTGLHAVATSGSYNDLADKPVGTQVDWVDVLNKPTTFTPSAHTHVAGEVTGLHAVATSGDYNALTNLPTIPTTPEEVGADPAGTAANAVLDAPKFLRYSGGWPARGTTSRAVFFIGGSAATDAPTDVNLAAGDMWFPGSA